MENTAKNAQALVEIGLITAIVALIVYATLCKFGVPLDTATQRAVDSVTSSDNMWDYCRNISPGASYEPVTHECRLP